MLFFRYIKFKYDYNFNEIFELEQEELLIANHYRCTSLEVYKSSSESSDELFSESEDNGYEALDITPKSKVCMAQGNSDDDA